MIEGFLVFTMTRISLLLAGLVSVCPSVIIPGSDGIGSRSAPMNLFSTKDAVAGQILYEMMIVDAAIDFLLNSGIKRGQVNEEVCERAQENALSVTFDMFKAQVVSFLNPEHQNQYDSSDVWDSVVLRVVGALGRRS